MTEIIEELFRVIEERRDNPRENSYTSSLMEAGQDEIIEKLGEEFTEAIIASKNNDKDELVHEGADIIYHLFVLFAKHEIELEEFLDELEDRRR